MTTTRSEVGCIYKYGTVGIEESCVERADYKLHENSQLHSVNAPNYVLVKAPLCI